MNKPARARQTPTFEPKAAGFLRIGPAIKGTQTTPRPVRKPALAEEVRSSPNVWNA
ncbi:MAG: hypothetical protein GTO60_14750 [Gammaproteobacteria bacterium]|nr:hypothetical protein [Gammaproteobacteria bacterium]NIN61315.1 hypothetical protein [Gammaproteobacteria bacterium]NIT05144.1 hypothetical protein [Gammaproteobacteria bacterium]